MWMSASRSRISGPIEKGEVELRPLTIFVGASNTGKTCFSVLIYSLHNMLEGFTRIPVVGRLLESFVGSFVASAEKRAAIFGAAGELGDKLGLEDRPFKFSDLPEQVQDEAKKTLLGSDGAVEGLVDELRRCFDLPSASRLIRAREGIDRAKVSLGVREGMRDLWRFDATVLDSRSVVAGEIEDMVLVPARGPNSELGSRLEQIAAHLEAGQFSKALAELPYVIGLDSRQAHYLPAARSGIMQSHRVIASAVMARATRAGLGRVSELPTFPGPLADFMQQLIEYKGHEDGFRRASKTFGSCPGDRGRAGRRHAGRGDTRPAAVAGRVSRVPLSATERDAEHRSWPSLVHGNRVGADGPVPA